MSLSPEQPEPAAEDVRPSIIFRADALRQVESHMAGDTRAEYGGVLVGTVSAHGDLVVINTAVEVENSASAVSANFTLGHATVTSLNSQVAASFPGQQIVGWYHSHPRFGIFLSTHDLFIQATFFAHPWQVGYVFDPIQNVRGLFGWAGREIVRVDEWEVTASERGVDTQLPVNTPAHGEQLAARLLAAQRPAEAADAQPPSSVGGGADKTDAPVRKLSVRTLLVAAAAAIVVVVAAAVVLTSGDDAESPLTVGSVTTLATVAQTAQTLAPTSAVPATTAGADTSTSVSVVETTAAPAAVPVTAPPTPTAVQPPISRLAAPLDPCPSTGPNAYQPAGDCYLALTNGNILLFAAGALGCSEPSGTVIAPAAATFTVGNSEDPLLIVADGQLVAKCGDLTYAKNVLAGGADTFDGLCGSAGTAIDESNVRCFAQNPVTGAIAAIERVPGQIVPLTAACFNAAAGSPSLVPLTWTDAGVDTSWRIVSVTFDSGQQQFVATATKTGNTATATFACA